MAKSLGDSELWLPSKFLTEEEALMGKENLNKNGFNTTTIGFEPSLTFPTEFPYEFDSFGSNSALSSPVESVAGSTETESSDEEDFFAGLTRRLTQSSLQETQKLTVPSFSHTKPEWVMAGSPQSTLSGIGSWSGRSGVSSNGSPNGPSQFPSPPTTPFGVQNDTWDLIYAAAGQVARLKVSGESQKYNPQSRGLLSYPNTIPAAPKSCNFGLYPNQPLTHNLPQTAQQFQHVMKPQCSSIWGRQQVKVGLATQQQREPQSQAQVQVQVQIQSRVRSTNGYESGRNGARPLGLPQSAWPSLQAQQQNQVPNPNGSSMRAGVLLSGSNTSVKRECAGTGVFLPRRYSNPPDSRKKTSCPTVLVPAKVVQALNLNFDDMNGHVQPRFYTGFTSDHDAIVARRNALLAQQRRSLRTEGVLNHEVHLPQEWTY